MFEVQCMLNLDGGMTVLESRRVNQKSRILYYRKRESEIPESLLFVFPHMDMWVASLTLGRM